MKIRWQPIVKIKASLLFQWYVFEGSKKKYVKPSLGIDFGFSNQKIVSSGIYIDPNEYTDLEKIFLSKLDKENDFFQKFIGLCYKHASRLLETSQRINKLKSYKSSNNKRLLKIYRDYQNLVLLSVPFLDSTLILNKILNKKIVKLFETNLRIKTPQKQDLLLSKLIIPKKKSYFIQETEIILKMAQDQKLITNQIIEKYLKEFAWLRMIAYVGKPATKKTVEKKIKELVEENPGQQLEKAKTIKKEKINDYQKAYQKIRGYSELVKLIDYAREFLYLLNYRLDIFFKAHYLVRPLFGEIGSRFGLTVEELVYLVGDEISNLLEGKTKLDRKELNKRISGYALIKIDNKFTIQSGGQIGKEIYGKIKVTIVKGQVANRGRATGKVKLVFETEDLDKVKRGDIMVSPMTRPNMVPAMMKAAGVITDFGGMLCHAAIISREFDVPCLVGTKNATKVFRDGDLVELNAYEGTARKLK